MTQTAPCPFMSRGDRVVRSVAFSGWSVGAVVIAMLSACANRAVMLGEGWHRVDFEPTDLHGPYWVIDYKRSGLSFNNAPLNEAQVLGEVRKGVPLSPRPIVFIRLSRKDQDEARRLAKEILGTGACSEGGCLFKLVDQ